MFSLDIIKENNLTSRIINANYKHNLIKIIKIKIKIIKN